jgi:hypothetical protein
MRQAAVKQGKVNIQDAQDFYKWAIANEKSISYRFYSSDDYEATSLELSNSKAKAVPGTMKLHAIYPLKSKLHSRIESCYCVGCMDGTSLCQNWTQHDIAQSSDTREDVLLGGPADDKGQNKRQVEIPKMDSFVAAEYENAWFIEKVIQVDENEGDAHISFMEKTRGKCSYPTYKWPAHPDMLWIKFGKITHSIELIPQGKTRRQFRLCDNDFGHFKHLVQD